MLNQYFLIRPLIASCKHNIGEFSSQSFVKVYYENYIGI